jgi:hypothetical protein
MTKLQLRGSMNTCQPFVIIVQLINKCFPNVHSSVLPVTARAKVSVGILCVHIVVYRPITKW